MDPHSLTLSHSLFCEGPPMSWPISPPAREAILVTLRQRAAAAVIQIPTIPNNPSCFFDNNDDVHNTYTNGGCLPST